MSNHHTRGYMIRRVAQMMSYIAEHRSGFYRREMCEELGIGEEPSRFWLAALEEQGLVWKWRRFRNEAYLWRGTFIIRNRPATEAQGDKLPWVRRAS